MVIYRVNSEDSIISIANRFRVPVFKLIKDNKLTCEVEKGDVVFIDNKELKSYLIEPNDSFNSIAKALNVSENYLKEVNQMDYLITGYLLWY